MELFLLPKGGPRKVSSVSCVGWLQGRMQPGRTHSPPSTLAHTTSSKKKNYRCCRKAATFCLFIAFLPWPAGSKDSQPCWASLGKAPSMPGTRSMEKGSVWTPGTPRCRPDLQMLEEQHLLLGERWRRRRGWWSCRRELLCSAGLAGDERYVVLCKELQQLPPEQRGAEQRAAAL